MAGDVGAAAREYKRAGRQLDRARGQLHAAILEALAAGVTQAELVRITGYTREHLRKLALEARPVA